MKRLLCRFLGHWWTRKDVRCWHGDGHLSARVFCPVIACGRCGVELL